MTDMNTAVEKMRSSAANLGLVSNEQQVAEDNLYSPDLPSLNLFYPEDKLPINIRQLKYRELIPLGVAQAAGSERFMAESIARTVTNYDGMELTFGDYQFLVYFHKLKMARPITMDWICAAEAHVKDVKEGNKEEESLKNTTTLRQTEIVENKLEADTLDNADMVALKELGFHIVAPTVQAIMTSIDDTASIDDKTEAEIATLRDQDLRRMEIVRKANRRKNEIEYMNKYATLLSSAHGKTLANRRKWLEDWFDKYDGDHFDVLQRMTRVEQLLQHGIKDTMKATCEACGQETEIPIPFLPTQFLPEMD